MVPLGFNTLVELVEKVQDWETHPLVADDSEMWSSFVWAVLLGGSKSEAEVNYVLGILENSGLTERSSLNPHWKDEAVSVLSEAKSEITKGDVNPEGKKGAIKKIEVELSQIDTTLKSADEIFNRTPRIRADYLRSIANNTDTEDRFIADFASSDIAIGTRVHPITTHTRKIPGIAYTKTILWMHRCGIG